MHGLEDHGNWHYCRRRRFLLEPVSCGIVDKSRRRPTERFFYHDPMHPWYKSDKPGTAPGCGMPLEPAYAGGGQSAEAESIPPGAVAVAAAKRQLMGVRVEQAVRSSAERHIRILARVAADEPRIYRLDSPNDGVVRNVGKITTGGIVAANQTLASYYTRVVVSGNFLIDSESRLQPAASGFAQAPPPIKDPVCGLDVDPSKATHKFSVNGKTYQFCSDPCERKFQANPASYPPRGGA